MMGKLCLIYYFRLVALLCVFCGFSFMALWPLYQNTKHRV